MFESKLKKTSTMGSQICKEKTLVIDLIYSYVTSLVIVYNNKLFVTSVNIIIYHICRYPFRTRRKEDAEFIIQ